jgi:hypothetical protein
MAILALRDFPRLALACLLALALMLAALFIPVSPGLGLLDRPLGEMALFLPLAFLGGLGASRLPRMLAVFLATAIIAYGVTAYSFAPSPCCQLAGPDDAAALDWMKKNLPAQASIGIASTELRLASTEPPLQAAGADAGIWIDPLTGRRTVPLPYFTDFEQPETHELLCTKKVTYLYVGGTDMSFRKQGLEAASAQYQLLFALPGAYLFQVQGCSP